MMVEGFIPPGLLAATEHDRLVERKREAPAFPVIGTLGDQVRHRRGQSVKQERGGSHQFYEAGVPRESCPGGEAASAGTNPVLE